MCVTDLGEVFAFGANAQGQLGLGAPGDVLAPKRVEFGGKPRAIQVCCVPYLYKSHIFIATSCSFLSFRVCFVLFFSRWRVVGVIRSFSWIAVKCMRVAAAVTVRFTAV